MGRSEFDLVLQPPTDEFNKILSDVSSRVEELFEESELISQDHVEPLEISFRLTRPLLVSDEIDREFFVNLKIILDEFASSKPRFTTVFGAR